MAVYTDIDDVTLSALLDAYDLGPPLAFKGIAEGVQNSNFLLETPKGRFILTVFEERTQKEHLPFFMGMMGHLASEGLSRAAACAGEGRKSAAHSCTASRW